MAVISERIGGEMVRLDVTIGVIEAVAAIEDDMVLALGRVQRGSYALTRALIVAGAKAAGREGDVDAWYDAFAPGRQLALSRLAYGALSAALAAGSDAEKKVGAAEVAEPERPAS